MEAREQMSKSNDLSRFALVFARGAALALLGALAAGCAANVDSSDDEPTPVDPGGNVDPGKGDNAGSPTFGKNVVVDCISAKDGVSVRTCKLGSTDSCTVAATVQATQVVKNTASVASITGTASTHNGKSVHLLNAAEAKLLADLHHMKLLLSSAGKPASTAYEYTKTGAPFVYAAAPTGMSVVTRTSANDTIARVQKALKAAAPTCSNFRVASTDGITPIDVSFVCEKTSSDTLLFCDGTVPDGIDYAVGASAIVNGVALNFVKAGCGAFGYDLVNQGDTAVTVKSQMSGVTLAPDCNFGIGAKGDGYCDAADIVGPTTVTYSGTITRGSSSVSFSLPVKVRCTSP